MITKGFTGILLESQFDNKNYDMIDIRHNSAVAGLKHCYSAELAIICRHNPQNVPL